MDRTLSAKERSSAKKKKILPYIIGVGAAASLVTIILMSMRVSVNSDSLNIAQVDKGTIQTSVSGTGVVKPAFEEIITSPISSRIVQVYCKAGDSVFADTPLLKLDLQSTETELRKIKDQIEMKRYELQQQNVNNDTHLSDLAMQIKVKEMAVDRMKVELDNEKYLDSLGSGTGDRIKQAELAYATGMLELEQMHQQLENERKVASASSNVKNLEINISGKNLDEMSRTLHDAQIRAPRQAILTYICDQVGQKISEGEKIAILSDLSHFRVDGEIADSYSSSVQVGSEAVVRIGTQRLHGIISNFTPTSQNGVTAFTVRLDDDANPTLRSGAKSDVYVLCALMEDVTRLKNGSYYTGPGVYDLFVMSEDGESLHRQSVRLGESNYEYVEVVSGLRPGEKVVINDMKEFKNETKIRIKN